jgi:hypothetical protein
VKVICLYVHAVIDEQGREREREREGKKERSTKEMT